MAAIPSAYLDAVVALGIEQPDGNKFWIGTGFIVGRKEINNPTMSTYYIVTNKHVIRNQRRILVRFNSTGSDFVKDYPIDLILDNGLQCYSAHPENETDVVAIQIRPQKLIEDKSIWSAFDLTDNALTLEQMQKSGIYEGHLVHALGFPMNLVASIKAPICRLGCISRILDAFVLKKKTPIFMVDMQIFPGNSGGPIISRPEPFWVAGTAMNDKSHLIGVLSAYLPYRDTLVSQQTGEVRMVQTENSGLTIVHPVDRIKEVVELEWQRCCVPVKNEPQSLLDKPIEVSV